MDIVFVILHYMAIKETYESVQYIRENLDTDRYHIVIVDNASGNGTGEILQERYEGSKDVTVIINSENEGFARGNNVGFRYAKGKWNPRYIVLMNNDVYLLERTLTEKLDKEYAESSFAVLGPMIMTRDGRCNVNPQYPEFPGADDIEKKIRHYKKDLRRYQYHYAPVYYKLASIKGALVGRQKSEDKEYLTKTRNVKLHGCFLVFSQEYIKSYDGLDESTFLFWEEEFLYKHMVSNGKTMIYTPDIVVYHLEDASTDAVLAENREKKIFMLKHYIDSLERLKKLYMEYEEINGKQKK